MRDTLRFVTCGSVDDGKSTLIGRLLWESKQVFEDQLSALAKDSTRYGTQGEAMDLALLVDGLQAEREQSITIDVAYRFFTTPRRRFVVADTPGHEQYTRNMATGASTSDLAVLVVNASKGLQTQTHRHARIVATARHSASGDGSEQDGPRWPGTKLSSLEIVQGVPTAVSALGFESFQPIPVSALNGDNITGAVPPRPGIRGQPS